MWEWKYTFRCVCSRTLIRVVIGDLLSHLTTHSEFLSMSGRRNPLLTFEGSPCSLGLMHAMDLLNPFPTGEHSLASVKS